jgi:hypothetical protein
MESISRLLSPKSWPQLFAIRAIRRLSDTKTIFADRQWPVLPQGIRGQRILRWGADQAYVGCPANPERSVRRWCRKWPPRADLDEIVGLHQNLK